MDNTGQLILSPEESFFAGESEVGGKAMGLARLERAGVRVPSWFVIGTGGLMQHVVQAGLWSHLRTGFARLNRLAESDSMRTEIQKISKSMRSSLLDAPLPDLVANELAECLAHLGEGPFAIRSSMVGEDSDKHSFAGQLVSYLFQNNLDQVCESVRQCWASAFSSRVFEYRLRIGESLGMPNMGVVVQTMVAGTVSGVGFSAHPVTGRRDHALITAAWGQGEGVVSGLCNTDEFVYDHSGQEVSHCIAVKDVALMPAQNGSPGTVEVKIPRQQQEIRCLEPQQVQHLGSRLVSLAQEMGAPLDIEWTLEDGIFYFLQARPITRLPEPENREGPRVVFDNSNIQESYNGVTTPLTFSFASRAYASVYEQIYRLLGIRGDRLVELKPLLRNLLGLVRGRVYYNINNWYRGLLVLPSFGRNKDDMEKMMGLENPVDFVEDQDLTLWEKLERIPEMTGAMVRLVREIRKLDRSAPRFLDEFENAYRRIDRNQFRNLSYSALIEVLELIDQLMLSRWETPIVNDFFVMMASGKLRRLVESTTIDDPNVMINNLLAGEEGIESTEPTRWLMRMAKDARHSPSIMATLSLENIQEVFSNLRSKHPEFVARLDDYIERYGDRVMGELKLETVTLREDPSFVIRVLQNYLTRSDLDPDKLVAKEKHNRSEAEQRLSKQLGLVDRRRLPKILRDARTAVKYRENLRLARTRMFGLYREVFCAMGQRLFEVGRLEHPRDVFWLSFDELQAYHEGRALTTNLAALASVRKQEFAEYESQDLPHHFETIGPVYHGNHYRGPTDVTPIPQGRVLEGIGCYPGVVESTVRVINNPDEELSVNGKILAAVRTDPGWAPLFPTTSGLLIERGSTLSHSAVVARELGIPAVVGIPHLIKVIRDGERIRLDGGAGRVERLEVAES